ncbi:MAG: ABC transporter permease [Rhodospirillales bacterium]|nr:ABC transporter permease [Rhodospirillales bacterium]
MEAVVARARAVAGLFLGDAATRLAFGYLALVVAVAIFASWIAEFPPLQTSVGPAFARPGVPYFMGTDDLGRDIFSGVVHGARVSLGVGFVAATASAFIGVVMGVVAGYFGGRIDVALMRVTEVFFVIPMVFLAILLVAFFGSGIWNVIFVIVILSWPATARLVRGQVLSLKEREFIKAARALGEGHAFIMFREILPNTLAPIIVNGSIQMAQAIVVEAGLSFLGLGDQNLTSWGVMLFRSQRFLMQEAWWTFVFPGLALFLTVLALNVLADSLNNILNPRTRHRKA